MKSLENTSKTLFTLLTSKDFNVTILDTDGKAVSNSADARIFNFDYSSNGTDYGSVVVLLSPENSIDIFCGDSFGKHMNSDDKSNWYEFLYQMRMFAKRHLFSFSVKDMSKLKFTMQDIASAGKDDPLSESWSGNKRQSVSAGPGGKTKLIIKHDKQINDEAGDKRYRNIDKLFIESESGERFAVPSKNLSCGRMLARHVAEGGTPYDDKGKHICGIVDDIQKLSKFVRSTHNKEVPADTKVLVEKAVEHYNKLKQHAKSIVSQKGYHSYFDNWSADQVVDADQDLEPLRELFTNKAIDARVENALPILSRINKQGSDMSLTKQYESWANNLAEGTWAMPDTPEKLTRLKELLADEILVGIDAQNATGLLYDLLGNDDLFDALADDADMNPDDDARDTIIGWLLISEPALAKQLGLEDPEIEEGLDQDIDYRAMQVLKQKVQDDKWKRHIEDDEKESKRKEKEVEEDVDGHHSGDRERYANPRFRQEVARRASDEKWARQAEYDKRDKERVPVEEERNDSSVMSDASNLFSMMKGAISGNADRKEPFDWLAKLRQENGKDYAMQVYKQAQALVNSGKTVSEDVDETDPVISPSTQIKRSTPAKPKKQVSAATRIKNAYENGDLMGADHVAKSSDGTFIFRRTYFYSHGGSSEKFAAKVDNMLTAIGIAHEIVDHGDHYAPFRGGASIKTSQHWWVKVRVLDNEPVAEGLDDAGSAEVTPATVADAWYSVFPNSMCNARNIMGDNAFSFRLAKDKSEVSNGILENDPLSYSAFIRDGNWEEHMGSLSIAPEAGSYMAYGSARLRKKTIKNVTKEQLIKRFKEVHAFVSANADKMHNIKFDIADKLSGNINEAEGASRNDEYTYKLLGRLQADCEYYLNAGNKSEKHLWAGNVADQIAKMRELYDSLPEDSKPQWLTQDKIAEYESAMTNDVTESVETDERKWWAEYYDNEDRNARSENIVHVANLVGDEGDKDEADRILQAHMRRGYLTSEIEHRRDMLHKKLFPLVRTAFRKTEVTEAGLAGVSNYLGMHVLAGIKFELDQYTDGQYAITANGLHGMIQGAKEKVMAIWKKLTNAPKSINKDSIIKWWENVNDSWHTMRTAESVDWPVEKSDKQDEFDNYDEDDEYNPIPNNPIRR